MILDKIENIHEAISIDSNFISEDLTGQSFPEIDNLSFDFMYGIIEVKKLLKNKIIFFINAGDRNDLIDGYLKFPFVYVDIKTISDKEKYQDDIEEIIEKTNYDIFMLKKLIKMDIPDIYIKDIKKSKIGFNENIDAFYITDIELDIVNTKTLEETEILLQDFVEMYS